MTLKCLPTPLSICKLSRLDGILPDEELFFLSRIEGELSLVCPTARIPSCAILHEDGFRAMRIEGRLDFSLIGILSRLLTVLAQGGIGVFALSTYDTDTILVKEESLFAAVARLREAGYEILDGEGRR